MTRNMVRRAFRIVLACALLSMLAGVSVNAQQPQFKDPLLDHMVGHWLLQGTLGGKPQLADVEADWVMGHQYLRIRETSRTLNAAKEPDYESTIYIGWNDASSSYGCIFIDSLGGLTPFAMGTAKRNGDEIPFLFIDNGTDFRFHTTLAYNAKADTWQWQLDSELAGKLNPFGRETLTREK